MIPCMQDQTLKNQEQCTILCRFIKIFHGYFTKVSKLQPCTLTISVCYFFFFSKRLQKFVMGPAFTS